VVKLFSGTPLSHFSEAPAADGPSAPKRRARPAAPIPEPEAPKLRLVPIARLAQGGRWRVEAMRAYCEPVLLWFTRGQGRVTVGGITRGYGAHNAIYVPAGMMHGFEVGVQTSGTALFFGADHGLNLPDEPLHLRIREVGPQTELSGIIENIQREMEGNKPGNERAAHHHLGLLGIWLERHVETSADETPRADASRRLARAYADLLERGFRSGKGVADYARELGVTPTHLTRVCNKTCGRSASDLLHDRVIFEARRLLAETRLPVAAVAETLGFTSPAYFTRAFQHRTGKTPTSFRKAH
jgi:AraC-like DNA-binding protein